MNICIVDDNKFFVDAMKIILGMLDGIYIVYTASNGKEFLQHPNFQQVDLAFTDISMPILSGIDAMRLAKQMKPEMKIIAVSNMDKKLSEAMIIEAGASEFLEKDHISKSVLSEVVNNYYCKSCKD